MQQLNVSLQRQADAVFNGTPCYVLSFYQNLTVNGNAAMTWNTSESYLHTYWIAKDTFHILSHYARRISEPINDTREPLSDALRTRLIAEGTVTYFDYNVPVTIEAPTINQ